VAPPPHVRDMDPRDIELLEILVMHPEYVGQAIAAIDVGQLHSPPARKIFYTIHWLHDEQRTPDFGNVLTALDDPAMKNIWVEVSPPPHRGGTCSRQEEAPLPCRGGRAAQAERRPDPHVSRQMAEIPLLTRDEEIALAKKIEVTRKRFRRSVLAATSPCGHRRDARKVHRGELPFDRTIKVSLTERLTKEQIQARMPHNLQTLERLLEKTAGLRATDSLVDARAERPRPKAFLRRRRKCLQLVEELSLRTRRVQPLMKAARGVLRRMDEIRRGWPKIGATTRRQGRAGQPPRRSCAT
jgi:hypothetical protein